MNLSLSNRAGTFFAALAVLTIMAAMYGSLKLSVEPFYILAGVVAIALGLFIMRKWPIAIGIGLQFVGNFKTVPAQGFELTDPTMIVLLLCIGAVLIQILFAFAKLDECSLASRFRGQAAVTLLFVMLCASIAIGTFYTPTIQHGLMKTLRFVVFESLSFFYPILFLKDRKDVRQMVRCFVIVGLALSAKILLQLLHPSESMMEGDTDITQIGNGMLLAITLLIVIVDCELPKAMKYFSVGALSFGLVACAARSPLVAFLFTIVVTAVYAKGRIAQVSRRTISAGGIFALLVIVPTLLWMQDLPVAQRKLEGKEEELVSALSGSPFMSGTVAQRLDFYRSALEAMAEHPILGVGTGGWSIFYDNQDLPHFPHNFVLEVGAEQGLIGLTILMALLTILLRNAFHVLRSTQLLAFVFPVFVFCVSLNLITGDIESRNLWFCCGLVAAAARLSTSLENESSTSEKPMQRSIILKVYPISAEPEPADLSSSSRVVA